MCGFRKCVRGIKLHYSSHWNEKLGVHIKSDLIRILKIGSFGARVTLSRSEATTEWRGFVRALVSDIDHQVTGSFSQSSKKRNRSRDGRSGRKM